MVCILGDRSRGLATLEQIHQRTDARDWLTFHAKRWYFLGIEIQTSLVGLVFCGLVGAIVVTPGPINQSSLGFLIKGLLVLLGIVGIVLSLSYFAQIPQRVAEEKMVLMPDGVVEYQVKRRPGESGPTYRVIFYDQILQMHLKTWVSGGGSDIEHLHVVLSLDVRNGTRYDWELDDRFGSKMGMAKRIMTDFAAYQVSP